MISFFVKDKEVLYNLMSHYFGEDLCKEEAQINKINFASEDIDAFFEDFQKSFNIDMTAYNYYQYFHENFLPFGYLISKMFIYLGFKKKKIPLSVSHLLEVVERGVWFVPN